MSNKIKRKLAAVMFVDIANFTSLAANNEKKALDLLDIYQEVVSPNLSSYNGILHKEQGDGALYSFPTVTEAIEFALKIQEISKSVTSLDLRIGIHEGEITFKNDDIFGDDVNIASRVEAFSPIGGIAISGKVQQNILSLPNYKTKYIGSPKLKGVAQKVEIHNIVSHGLPTTDVKNVNAKLEKNNLLLNIFKLTGSIVTVIGIVFRIVFGLFNISLSKNEQLEIPSLGILKIENWGEGNTLTKWRGVTEDLIIKVSSGSLIRIPPISEVLNLDNSLSINEKAKNLSVDYILSSSINYNAKKFVLRCQLIDAMTGQAIYSKKWTDKSINLYNAIDSLSLAIISTLNISKNDSEMVNNQQKYNPANEFY